MNKKAVNIINRVRDKLTGRDFATEDPVDVQRQVELLIQQATSHENLCQCYIGWSVPLVWYVCVCVPQKCCWSRGAGSVERSYCELKAEIGPEKQQNNAG